MLEVERSRKGDRKRIFDRNRTVILHQSNGERVKSKNRRKIVKLKRFRCSTWLPVHVKVRLHYGHERMIRLLANEFGREFDRDSSLSCKSLVIVHFTTFTIIRSTCSNNPKDERMVPIGRSFVFGLPCALVHFDAPNSRSFAFATVI